MIIYLLLYLFVAIFGVFVFGASTVVFATITYFIGIIILFIANKNKIGPVIKIYQIVYIVGCIYIYACYLYMNYHGYNYLLADDIIGYFLPRTEWFLSLGSIDVALAENWSIDSFFKLSHYHSGFFTYLIPFAYLSDYLTANLYVSMQFTTLLTASLSAVVIFKLFLANKFNDKEAYKYTIIICLFSVLFFYSTQLLRDMHVMFLYLLGIYLTFEKSFSLIHLAKILVIILISCSLRIETGLFQFVLIPVYLILSMQRSKNKTAAVLVSIAIVIAGFSVLALNSNGIADILSDNSENYLETDKGAGIIGTLQTIPIAGKPLSVIYNAVQPLPFWLKYEATQEDYRPQMYNIMTFPLSTASLFNWITMFFIFFFLTVKNIRKKIFSQISKPLLYQLYIGLFYLYVQSTVIAQRRLMAYYVIFYILFYIIYTNLSRKDRRELMFGAVASYSVLQLTALFYQVWL